MCRKCRRWQAVASALGAPATVGGRKHSRHEGSDGLQQAASAPETLATGCSGPQVHRARVRRRAAPGVRAATGCSGPRAASAQGLRATTGCSGQRLAAVGAGVRESAAVDAGIREGAWRG